MRVGRRMESVAGTIMLLLTAGILSGCMPDGLLITPISRHQELEEQTIDREALLTGGKVAVIDVEGVILNAAGGGLLLPREHPVVHLLEQLDKAREDFRVKAVILRINSPGGSVTASELMHHEILRFREAGKPVVAMMTDVAASGGYYIACACDEIYACRSTVTGSIGVIMQTFDATGTMQKIGLKAHAIKSGELKGAGSPFETLSPEERAVFQAVIMDLYEQFVDVVAAGRPELTREEVLALADGRIYTAPQALERKLIDHIGTMDHAVARAKQLAGIETTTLVTYVRPWGYAPNYYARQAWAAPETNIGLLNLQLGDQMGRSWPPFMYLMTY